MPASGTAFFYFKGFKINLYLDESGDLGLTFDKPYRYGGSSRHLTIAFLLVPKELSHLPKRIVKKLYQRKKQPTSKELKGSEITSKDSLFISLQILSGKNMRIIIPRNMIS
jgi:hypothetical protein